MRPRWALPVLALLLGCPSQPPPPGSSSPPPPLVADPPLRPAALVALAHDGVAIRLAAHSRTQADLILSNGTLAVETHAQVVADAEVRGDLALAAFAELEGDCLVAGTASLAPHAHLSGALQQHAAVAEPRYPGSSAFLQSLGADFGELGPDLEVPRRREVRLPAGEQTVRRAIVRSGGSLIVDEPARLKVTEALTLEPNASVVVRPGGRLTLHLLGALDLSPGSRLVQEGSAGRGLVVVLGPDARVHWQPRVAFGPGLLYAPEVELDLFEGDQPAPSLSRFQGALVVRAVATRSQADLALDSRFLRCPADREPPTVHLLQPSGRLDREVPAGTATVVVEGVAHDDAGLDVAVLTDAVGSTPLSLDASGRFTATARLRADGEPTSLCVQVRDCSDQVATDCALIATAPAIDFALTSPAPGAVVQGSPVTLTGRVFSGAPTSVRAANTVGYFSGSTFTVPDVPLAPGVNVVLLRLTSASGATTARRLVIAAGAMAAEEWRLDVDQRRAVTLRARSQPLTVTATPPTDTGLQYRLLDASGAELYRSGIPGTVAAVSHFDTAAGEVGTSRREPLRTQRSLLVPRVPGAAGVEFLDETGRRVGGASL